MFWQEIARDLRERIRRGRLAPGQRLPTERELIAGSGRSRNTVRRAVAQLAADGLVECRGRRGAVVLGTGGPVVLAPGESVTAATELTLTRVDGSTLALPAGTPVVAAAGAA